MRDSKLFCLDRTLFPLVNSTVFAILLFALMMMADAPPFGRSNLPKANYPEVEPYANDYDATVVTILNDGRVFWHHDPVSAGDLLGKLNHLSQWRPEKPIYLAVDARTSYKDLAGVLEVLQSAKVAKVIFLVEQRKYWISFVEDSRPHFWDPVYLWIRRIGWDERISCYLRSCWPIRSLFSGSACASSTLSVANPELS